MTRIEPMLFLDESGDLSFNFNKPKTSRYFIVAFLLTDNHRKLDKIVSKIFSGFNKVERKAHRGALHCVKETDVTRLRLLKEINDSRSTAFILVLDKYSVTGIQKQDIHNLYNELVCELLVEACKRQMIDNLGNLRIIASRRETNKYLNLKFVEDVEGSLGGTAVPQIEIVSANEMKGLQAVDFVSWSFFQKYEFNQPEYADLLAECSVEIIKKR